MFDILIRNGTVHDGTGTFGYEADVGIAGDRIVEVAVRAETPEGLPCEARAVIDAAGRIVTPGFIDVHSHSDITILANPESESKLRQGITTEIIGNCGMSGFPLRGPALDEERPHARKLGVEIDWETPGGYIDRVMEARPSVNLALLVGHGNIRGSVMGFEDRAPTQEELDLMLRDVEEAMDAGALGMSTGLIYPPGMFAETDEIIELQRMAARKGGIYASHVRGEGDRLLSSADEFAEIMGAVECQGQYSHLKASGQRNWGKASRVVERIEELNDRGIFVRFDKYPYTASGTALASLLPRWVLDGGTECAVERLCDPPQRERVIRELREDYGDFHPWPHVLIVDAGRPELDEHDGKRIAEIARSLRREPEDIFIELLVRSRLATSMCNFTMSQAETDMAILHPMGMVCTDAEGFKAEGPLASGNPHPRGFGSFGKYFREYVREQRLLKLEEAVAKVTSFPCEVFGFRDRGRIKKGCFADLLVIDWPNYTDRATYSEPHQYCEGLDAIIVNGKLAFCDGRCTDQRAGRILERS